MSPRESHIHAARPDEPTRDEPTRDEPTRDEPTRDEPTRDEPTRDERNQRPAAARAEAEKRAPAPGAQGEVDRILETIVYLYTESRRVTKSVARRHGLTGPQVTVLKILEQFGGALSLSELSARMSARNSTLTGIVDRMERDGLVTRRRSPSDRRVVHIEPTARGRELAAAVPVDAMSLLAGALRDLDEAERARLTQLLSRVADGVRSRLSPARLPGARELDDDLEPIR